MIFRIVIYVVNNLLRHFLDTDKEEREKKEFRLNPEYYLVNLSAATGRPLWNKS